MGVDAFRAWILTLLVTASVGLCGAALLLAHDWPGLLLSLGTNLLSTAALYYLVDRMIGGRERKAAEESESSARRLALLGRMASTSNSVAVAAVDEIRQRGWLYDGSLRGIDLRGANLRGANLSRADLRTANFSDADLQGVQFILADLANARLDGATLQKASFVDAQLRNATFVSSDLAGADLRNATLDDAELLLADLSNVQLQGASLLRVNFGGARLNATNLSGSDLRGARADGASCEALNLDITTTLPDGTQWSSDRGNDVFGALIDGNFD